MNKEEALEKIQQAKQNNVDLEDSDHRAISSYISKTRDDDVIISLLSLNERYARYGYILEAIKFKFNNTAGSSTVNDEKRKYFCDFIVKMITSNPNTANSPLGQYVSDVNRMIKLGIINKYDPETTKIIEQGVEAYELRCEKMRPKATSNQGILKNSNAVATYHCPPKEEVSRPAPRLYVNPGGSLSYRPTGPKSKGYTR